MTILAPSVAARPVESPTATTRQYLRYLFYKARPSCRLVPHGERTAARAQLLAALEPFAERLPVLRAYSTVGTRGDADFLLWMVSERLEDFLRSCRRRSWPPPWGRISTRRTHIWR